MSKRTYRTRPLRGKNKPYTLTEPATLLDWITTYSFMLQSPQCWFANWTISQSELADVYKAGYHGLALALGYQPYKRPETVDFSQPIVATIGKAA